MHARQVLQSLLIVLVAATAVGCTRSMGRLSDVRLQRVPWAEVDKRGLSAGCCSTMEWIRVDFLSDMDYARLVKHGVHLSVRYGWCPIDGDRNLGVTRLYSDSGEVDGMSVLVPAAGHTQPPLYAYHGLFPSSRAGRSDTQPGVGEGAYDLRNARGDFCIAVGGGAMWWGRHGQSKGGVVSKAELSEIVGP